MDRKDVKKILAGLSIAGLLAGTSMIGGCAQKPQETPVPAKEAPATAQEAPAPAQQAPAPSS